MLSRAACQAYMPKSTNTLHTTCGTYEEITDKSVKTQIAVCSRAHGSHVSNITGYGKISCINCWRTQCTCAQALEPVKPRLEFHRLQGLDMACICCSSQCVCMHVLGFATSEESLDQSFRKELKRHLRAHVQAYYMQTWLVWFSPCTVAPQIFNLISNCQLNRL